MPLTRSLQSLTAAHGSACRVCGKTVESGKTVCPCGVAAQKIILTDIIKEASIKRHERYCRKRLTHPVPPRRKSCFACIRAKSRCDSRNPACGPCQRKGRSCIYSSESLSSRESPLDLPPTQSCLKQQFPDALTAVATSRRGVSHSAPLNCGVFITFEAASLSVAPEPSAIVSSEPGNIYSAEVKAATELPLRKTDLTLRSETLEISHPPSSYLLRPRKQQSVGLELVSKLVSQMLCSFPDRRMNEDSCPSFIHFSTFQQSANNMSLEDPILNCQNIACMFVVRKAHGEFSVWDAITSEQERIYDQRTSLDRSLHLSSAQAITIYLLMLAAEGESVLIHHPNIPITLLYTLGSIFGQLNQMHPGFIAAKEMGAVRPTWEDWIFAESKLRTATVYFILALHFDVDFGIPCDREGDYTFEDVNLPAAKLLWEAKNELSWREEFDLIERGQDDFMPVRTSEERLKYGDLVRFNKQHYGYKYPDIQNDEFGLADRIEKWQKGVDEFGMLVALCSTMV